MALMRTGNNFLMKEINRNIILNLVRDNFPISRAAIAERSGVNRSTVSAIVDELINEGIVYESGPGESSGGRKPILLEFNPMTALVVGIDIGGNILDAPRIA